MKTWYKRLRFEYHRIMHDYYVQQSVMVPQRLNLRLSLTYSIECFRHGLVAMKLAREIGLDYKIWS